MNPRRGYNLAPKRINENPETILKKITSAMTSENFILAMFLEHGTIKSYLCELILIYNQRDDGRVKEPIETFKRFTADILMSMDNILGLINDKNSTKISKDSTQKGINLCII
jgi:hypothetical protein